MSFLSRPIAVVLLSAAALVIPASAQDVAAASVVGSRSAASLPDTWNAVNDFNQTNAPGGVFTYGVGLLPGQFARMGTVVANTVGTPTTFISNGGSQPYVSFVLWNGMSTNTSDNTIRQPPNLLRMDPQLTPGTIVRFTAPSTASYAVTGYFQGIDTTQHSTVLGIYAKGTQLFTNIMPNSGYGTKKSFDYPSVALAAGETVDFVVATNSNCCYLAVGLSATITGPDTTAPIGAFDTPIDNSTGVVGAIGVTGWALDNVGVTKVEIYRDPVAGETGGKFGWIYIGDGVFVNGARPDVESFYAQYPNAARAGWGYQLLTNMLPNSGNGTYRLHAVAYDALGHTLELGAPGRTITCSNSTATKPFGTLDTPAQGATVSGAAYVNFGWALTPGTAMIPIDGSTIRVMIDGALVGHPTYNQARADIATLFPGYTNSAHAVGYYFLNTTALSNGVHTISWNVFDDASRGEGIGSRYFTVDNGISGAVAPTGSRQLATWAGMPRPEAVRDGQGLRLRRNALDAPLEDLLPGPDGRLEVIAEQYERLEFHLGAVTEGWMKVASERRQLPAGSQLDPESGIFYWQTAAPFLGDFELEFGPREGTSEVTRILVHIVPQRFSPVE